MPRSTLRHIIRAIRKRKRESGELDTKKVDARARGNARSGSGLLTILVSLIPFDLALLFATGWLYNRYYLSIFGLDQRLLDFGLYDEAAKGFAVALTHTWLVLFALAFVLTPLYEHSHQHRKRLRIAWIVVVMLVCTSVMGWFGAYYGFKDGMRDISSSSQLPTALFRLSETYYSSQVVYLKGDYIFLARVHKIDELKTKNVVEVRIYKLDKLEDLKLVGR